jgi:hypothetical protein
MKNNKQHALKAIFDQEGGKILVAFLRSDIATCANKIATHWNTLTLDEFRVLGLEMSAKERLARNLENAGAIMEQEAELED